MELNMMKKVFDRCLKEGTGQKVFIKLEAETNINSETLIKGLQTYYKLYASIEEKNAMQEVLKSQRQGKESPENKYAPYFEAILKTKDKSLIIKYLRETGINDILGIKSTLEPALNKYLGSIDSNLSSDKMGRISGHLDMAIKVYKDYVRNLAKSNQAIKTKKNDYAQEKRDMDHIELLNDLKEIASSPYQTSKEYYSNTNKSDVIYKRYLNVTIKRDKELFKKYCEVMVAKMSDSNLGKEDLKSLINLIKNGIDDRSFDILDYYHRSNVSTHEMVKICAGGLSIEDYVTIKTFLTKHMYPTPLNLEDEFNTVYKITLNKELTTITDDIKIEAYNYLVKNKLPLYHTVFEVAVNRIAAQKNQFQKEIK